MTTPLIEAQKIYYRYEDGTLALDGIDFRLMPGETVALLGPNGSGKTTFILRLVGLLKGDGEIRIGGEKLTADNLPRIRARIGIVFQDSEEQLFMPTVIEDVAFGPRNLGLSPEDACQAARAALDRVGLGHLAERPPYHLSAGEKRRVALAGVLAMSPEILVLDEPTTFLDPPARRALIALLADLPQAKVLITHDIPFARALASRAVFFERGKVADDGDTNSVVKRFGWEL